MLEWAHAVARACLADPLPRQWRHVQAVGARAKQISIAFGAEDAEILVSAAYLHDIGYAPELALTGFHPLDGARFLRDSGAPPRLANLVAQHSFAQVEAESLGLGHALAEFEDEGTPVRDALWFCDLTIGPDGQHMTVRERVAEIQSRCTPRHPLAQACQATVNDRITVVHRTLQRLLATGLV